MSKRPQKIYGPASKSDRPPPLTSIDIEIGRNRGSSVALEASPARLQASKKTPIPSLSQRIEELTKENGNLRQEVLFHQKMQTAITYLQQDTEYAVKRLNQAVADFSKARKVAEDELQRN
ncbi:MAG: hypothetical protein M1840_000547 [Geoglossum simile]|nr:MAG: hypothetical protein M1840_000547 [Geoglossum simile]